jgi:hypothetical protein
VILHRCFPMAARVRSDAPDGPLWFPRSLQGDGRHDNPDVYGCLYVADRPVSCVVELLAAFRGQRLSAALLRRRGLPLALAAIELADAAELVDLDDPRTLRREGLRPSAVATRQREMTQPQALDLFRRHPGAAGLRWWSIWESQWANVTLFDRAAAALRVVGTELLTVEHPVVVEAAEMFAMRIVRV